MAKMEPLAPVMARTRVALAGCAASSNESGGLRGMVSKAIELDYHSKLWRILEAFARGFERNPN
jgi:hypothetical protein